jgi:hypothetical protein
MCDIIACGGGIMAAAASGCIIDPSACIKKFIPIGGPIPWAGGAFIIPGCIPGPIPFKDIINAWW